jgi:hypothetical protein
MTSSTRHARVSVEIVMATGASPWFPGGVAAVTAGTP